MNFDDFIKESVATSKQNYLQPAMDGTIFVHAECKDPSNNATWLLNITDDETKARTLGMLALAFRYRGVEQYCCASLAWKSEYKTKEDFEAAKRVRPSEDPNRQEILIISAVHENGAKHSTIVSFERNGDKIDYTKEVTMAGAHIEGRLTELLECLIDDVPIEVLEAGDRFANVFMIGRGDRTMAS